MIRQRLPRQSLKELEELKNGISGTVIGERCAVLVMKFINLINELNDFINYRMYYSIRGI